MQVIQTCQFEGKTLVAIPHQVGKRTISKRILPPISFSKPVLLEMQASFQKSPFNPLEGAYFKLWVGFLQEEYVDILEILKEYSCDYQFEESGLLPYAKALVDMAQDHYAFFSIDGSLGAHNEEDPPPLVHGSPMPGKELDGELLRPEEYGSVLDARMTKLETMMVQLNSNMIRLMDGPSPAASAAAKRKPVAKAGSKIPAKDKDKDRQRKLPGSEYEHFSLSVSPENLFPNLDGGLVRAALQAGIPHQSLMEIQKLVTADGKAVQTKDLKTKVKPGDPLLEGEDLENVDEDQLAEDEPGPRGSGSGPTDALTKLTEIGEILTEEKRKKASSSQLDRALMEVELLRQKWQFQVLAKRRQQRGEP